MNMVLESPAQGDDLDDEDDEDDDGDKKSQDKNDTRMCSAKSKDKNLRTKFKEKHYSGLCSALQAERSQTFSKKLTHIIRCVSHFIINIVIIKTIIT